MAKKDLSLLRKSLLAKSFLEKTIDVGYPKNCPTVRVITSSKDEKLFAEHDTCSARASYEQIKSAIPHLYDSEAIAKSGGIQGYINLLLVRRLRDDDKNRARAKMVGKESPKKALENALLDDTPAVADLKKQLEEVIPGFLAAFLKQGTGKAK